MIHTGSPYCTVSSEPSRRTADQAANVDKYTQKGAGRSQVHFRQSERNGQRAVGHQADKVFLGKRYDSPAGGMIAIVEYGLIDCLLRGESKFARVVWRWSIYIWGARLRQLKLTF